MKWNIVTGWMGKWGARDDCMNDENTDKLQQDLAFELGTLGVAFIDD